MLHLRDQRQPPQRPADEFTRLARGRIMTSSILPPVRSRSDAMRVGLWVTAVCTLALAIPAAAAEPDATITVRADRVVHAISPHTTGACIEDVNHEIYGGIYSQMVFGESFQEPPAGGGAGKGFSVYGGGGGGVHRGGGGGGGGGGTEAGGAGRGAARGGGGGGGGGGPPDG